MRFDSRRLFISGALALALVAGCNGKGGSASGPVSMKTDDDKTAYALGMILGRQAESLKLSSDQIAIAKEGFADAAAGKQSQVEMNVYGPKVNELARKKQEDANKELAAKAVAQKQKDAPFVEAASKEKGAEKLPSGVIYKPTVEGKGAQAKPTDYVTVNYTGKLSDGTVFDASEKHGAAFKTFLNRVVPCWTEGVSKMKVGGKALLTCPSDTAYGDHGQGAQIPGGAALQFEVELVSIDAPPAPQGMMMPGLNGGGKIVMPANPHAAAPKK